MHIPDGFVSPTTYIAGTAVAVPMIVYAYKKTKKVMTDESFSLLSALTAFSFVIMMFNIPIPGGTSGHAVGMGILAILFGPWVAAFCVSITLFIQAIVFADGGITVFGINSIAMGFVGSFASYYTYKALEGRFNEKAVLFISGWVGIVSSSVVVALILGIQPMLGLDEQGRPLYFPFGLDVTIPAIVGSHALFFGMIEGIATALVVAFVNKLNIQAKKETAEAAQ
jgi:cobalt/nickel transport system permease protein